MTPPDEPKHEYPPRKPRPASGGESAPRAPRRIPTPAPGGGDDTLFAAPKYTPAPPPRDVPLRQPGMREGARPAVPLEDREAVEGPGEDILIEDEGRGFGYIFSAIFMTVGIVLGGIYGLREVMQRGYLDQYKFLYQEVNLLPTKSIQPPTTEGSFQMFLPDDGMMLTASLQRLRRNMKPAEKDRLMLETLFAPETVAAGARVLPEGTTSRAYYVVGRTGYLDMNEAFTKAEKPTPRAEKLAVYSIINSLLLNNAELDAIQILVEGKPVDTAWGWLDLTSPLGPDLSLIR